MLAAIPQKTGNLTFVYGAVAILSVLLVICYLLWEKKKERNFFLLFLCVAAANCGYFLQSVSNTLAGALWANRISYLGGAFAVLVMLLIIMDVCRFPCQKRGLITLCAITSVVFLVAATGGWLDLYYTQVSMQKIGMVTVLLKEYGPLHMLYPVYLFSYFAMMVGVIISGIRKKRMKATKYAIALLLIVLCNVCTWLVEQLIDVEFEFLSVSYIVTEIFLLLIYSMLREYQRLYAAVNSTPVPTVSSHNQIDDLLLEFSEKKSTLSAAEQRILQYYIDGYEIAQIPELAYVSINTVKKHNRSIYQKLGVNSRDELMLYIELFRRCGRLEDLR